MSDLNEKIKKYIFFMSEFTFGARLGIIMYG